MGRGEDNHASYPTRPDVYEGFDPPPAPPHTPERAGLSGIDKRVGRTRLAPNPDIREHRVSLGVKTLRRGRRYSRTS